MRKWIERIRGWAARKSSDSVFGADDWSDVPASYTSYEQSVTTKPVVIEQLPSPYPQTMSASEAQNFGISFAKAHLEVIKRAWGPGVAAYYAQGMVCTARDVMIETMGERKAYNALAQIADDTISHKLPQGKA